MKLSTLISAIFTSLFFFTFPFTSKAVDIAFCFVPDVNGNEQQVISGCRGLSSAATFCADAGFVVGSIDFNQLYCMDRNCVVANETRCTACYQGFYLNKGRCYPCPNGSVCNGYTFSCNNGYYNNGSDCIACHSSCKTCSGAKNNNCTSCDSRAYLSGGQCVDCPAHAVCDGSSYFSCATGYIKSDGACVKEEQEPTKTNTVNTCPSRMTLSADGCCCVNK